MTGRLVTEHGVRDVTEEAWGARPAIQKVHQSKEETEADGLRACPGKTTEA